MDIECIRRLMRRDKMVSKMLSLPFPRLNMYNCNHVINNTNSRYFYEIVNHRLTFYVRYKDSPESLDLDKAFVFAPNTTFTVKCTGERMYSAHISWHICRVSNLVKSTVLHIHVTILVRNSLLWLTKRQQRAGPNVVNFNEDDTHRISPKLLCPTSRSWMRMTIPKRVIHCKQICDDHDEVCVYTQIIDARNKCSRRGVVISDG